jgi:hypothetical protein
MFIKNLFACNNGNEGFNGEHTRHCFFPFIIEFIMKTKTVSCWLSVVDERQNYCE